VSRIPTSTHSSQAFAWDDLALELTQLDPIQVATLARTLVATLARHCRTDRVSIVFFDGENGAAGTVISTQLPSGSVCDSIDSQVAKVRENRQRLFIHEAKTSQTPGRSKVYRTDGCALFPLLHGGECFAVLCLSNISLQQLHELEEAGPKLEFILHQVEQLALYVAAQMSPRSIPQSLEGGELSLLVQLAERLDGALDSRSMFSSFVDVLSEAIPLELLTVIYTHPAETPRCVVCLQRALHKPALQRAFDDLAQQWQRRNMHTPLVDLAEARVFGSELLSSEKKCPPELELGRTLTVPVFLDSDLYALALVGASGGIIDDRRRVDLLGFLLHQLMLHVKKNLLLEYNSSLQTIDSLTGLHNESQLNRLLEREFDRAERYNLPLSLHIFDVDHFKDVNEAYGFETGDLLLKEIARILMENIRNTDIVARASGERFMLILPETHGKNADILANRLRRFIENFSFYMPNTNVFIKVTVSVGATSFLDHRPSTAAQFVEFADTALYFAKRHGRNQVVSYGYVMNMMLADSGRNG
jgi:diguanylate cyclase (GGDEF)-like protein